MVNLKWIHTNILVIALVFFFFSLNALESDITETFAKYYYTALKMLCGNCPNPPSHIRKRIYPKDVSVNSLSASHENWCTVTLLNGIITAQWEEMGM